MVVEFGGNRTASSSASLHHGVQVCSSERLRLEDVLMAVGEEIGYENILSASRYEQGCGVFCEGGGSSESFDKQRNCGK